MCHPGFFYPPLLSYGYLRLSYGKLLRICAGDMIDIQTKYAYTGAMSEFKKTDAGREPKPAAVHPNLKARVLPHSLEAEQAVLGSVMIDENAPVHILNELRAEDFYSPSHRVIFSAMQGIALKNKPVDIVTLVTELETLGQLEAAGGLAYITALSDTVPSASNYAHYAAIVKKSSVLRKLIDAAQAITDKAFTGDPEDDAIAFAEAQIFALAEKFDRSKLVPLKEPLAAAIKRIEEIYNNPGADRGIPTGFKRLDRLLNGFQGGDLVLIAARPGQGKTSIGMNFIARAALDGNRRTKAGKPDAYKCAVFSLEMPAMQLAKRLLCSNAKVNMARANSGELSGAEWKKVYNAKAKLDGVQLYIDDSSLSTPVEILSKCRRLKREKGLDLVMIDYLQLMNSGKRVESRQQEVSEITRMLKIAAKELGVPILLLSQMSREIEKRSDKTPQMADLRESGAIEQDADIIIFIHRKYGQNDQSVDEETRSRVQLIIAKHRNGELGAVDVRWRGDYVTFEDVDTADYINKAVPPELGGRESFVMPDDGNQITNKGEDRDAVADGNQAAVGRGIAPAVPPPDNHPSPSAWDAPPDGDGDFSGRSAEEIMRVPLKPGDDDDIF